MVQIPGQGECLLAELKSPVWTTEAPQATSVVGHGAHASIGATKRQERGVVLRLGKIHKIKGPGVIFVVPFIDYVRFIDTRTLTLNIPSQKVITRDNVPAMIDGVLFFNPGSPAPEFFSELGPTIGLLRIQGRRITPRILRVD